jgi:hypothetical protein
MNLSFAILKQVCCRMSHRWLEENRNKGLRWLISNAYERVRTDSDVTWSLGAELSSPAVLLASLKVLPEPVNQALLEAREAWLREADKLGTLMEDLIAICDKYGIDDHLED